MWPYQAQNYWSEHERDNASVDSEPPGPPREFYGPGGSDDEDSISFGSVSEAEYVIMSTTNPYIPVPNTTFVRLRCNCHEEITIRQQEMVIRNTLGPQNLRYYQPSTSANNEPTSNRNIPEAVQRPNNGNEIAVQNPVENVSSQRPFIFYTGSRNTDRSFQRNRRANLMVNRRRMQGLPQPSPLAVQVANRLVNYARVIRNAYEKHVCCLDCGFIPERPVTGQCGHTRCTKCIQEKGRCPCGQLPPPMMFVNVLLQQIIERTTAGRSSRTTQTRNRLTLGEGPSSNSSRPGGSQNVSTRAGPMRIRKHGGSSQLKCGRRILMTPQERFKFAMELVAARRYVEATPHLAIAAASGLPEVAEARSLLAQIIMLRSNGRDPRRLNKELNRSIRHLSSTPCVKQEDLECILCSDVYKNPVTTPCGHTFCRVCLERTLDYRRRCPLCLRTLQYFGLNDTRETAYLEDALVVLNPSTQAPAVDPDTIPIFLCTVAFPAVPCPLFIFDPRYWLMIRRVLESGSRCFGMIPCDREGRYANVGTILEVRDCVHLEDGRSILSTIGVSRFTVVDVFARDGCEMARIIPISDVLPRDEATLDQLKMHGTRVLLKSLLWMSGLNSKVLYEIDSTFGTLPSGDFQVNWWETRDGPGWLWWVIAILPLRTEIKVLILSTNCLLKRLLAVTRTLEVLAASGYIP